MKKLVFVLAGLFALQSLAWAESYSVQGDVSEVKWTATKVTGKHFGMIGVVSGTVEFTDDQFSGGEAVIDTTSLTVEDLEGQGKDKLTNHLKSADFFDVETFPTASIKITDVQPAGENLYDVTADLTIKDITAPVQFQAEVVKSEEGVVASATITVDRTLYDIRYGSGKFFENLGDKTIHDTFTLDVSAIAA